MASPCIGFVGGVCRSRPMMAMSLGLDGWVGVCQAAQVHPSYDHILPTLEGKLVECFTERYFKICEPLTWARVGRKICLQSSFLISRSMLSRQIKQEAAGV